ncbi:MAG: hypothetical protein ACI4TB_06225, partial [Lachnospiraceae bacterium]
LPLIKEIHGRDYPQGTPIEPLATEFSVERTETNELHSIRADVDLLVNRKDIYHLECEIQNDGNMVLRMLEYDIHLALTYHQSGTEGIELHFPASAVLYLQDNGSTPDELFCKIRFQDGTSCDYRIPVLKVQSYTLEEIKKKHLSVLIPFLPLRFRKRVGSAEIKDRLDKEELTSFYRQLILMLEEEVAGGNLTVANRNILLSLLNKSMIRVFYKNASLLKEVIEMTEPILETEFEITERYRKMVEDQKGQLTKMNKALKEKDAVIDALKAEIAHLKE